jgi:hypothetical protein
MANLFAYFMLFFWPLVVVYFVNRYPIKKSILWSITFATLFLPERLTVDLPLFPPLDKASITNLTLFSALIFLGKKTNFLQRGPATNLLFLYAIAVFISVEQNKFPLFFGVKVLPGLTHYDAFSSLVRFFISFLPFILGRRFLNDPNDNELIFKTFAKAGLFYSILMLFEIRMSPQLHHWIYGYTPAEFVQNVRAGGYRPIVFMGGGLPLAFMFSTFLLAAFVLYKNKVRFSRYSSTAMIFYMTFVLLLCKTWSALAYAFIGMFLIYQSKPKTQVKFAIGLAIFTFSFPLLRVMDWIPTRAMVNFIADLNSERAASLNVRFTNEDILLKRAMLQPYFGWGGWGRNRIFDIASGKDLSVTDGMWIIEMGTYGLIGYIFYFSLLILPIYYAAKAINKLEDHKHRIYVAALTLIFGLSVIDLLPNSNIGAIHLLLAGSLLGQSEQILKLSRIKFSVKSNNTPS